MIEGYFEVINYDMTSSIDCKNHLFLLVLACFDIEWDNFYLSIQILNII